MGQELPAAAARGRAELLIDVQCARGLQFLQAVQEGDGRENLCNDCAEVTQGLQRPLQAPHRIADRAPQCLRQGTGVSPGRLTPQPRGGAVGLDLLRDT